MGLASRGTDTKLQQPGVQQVEPVPGTASPTPGRAGLAEASCLGHPACTALLLRLPTFPRCHPPPPRPLPPPGQHPGSAQGFGTRKQGMPSPCHPWVPRLFRYLTITNGESSSKVNMAPGLHQSPTPTPYRASFDPRKTGHRHSGSLEPPQGAGTEPQPEAAPQAG